MFSFVNINKLQSLQGTLWIPHLWSLGIGDLVEGKLILLTALKITLKLNCFRILASLKQKGGLKGRASDLLGLNLISLKGVE